MSEPPSTPKRKRADPAAAVDTSFGSTTSEELLGDASPRTRVASKFQDLQLREAGSLDQPSDGGLPLNDDPSRLSPRKRLKFEPEHTTTVTSEESSASHAIDGHAKSCKDEALAPPVDSDAPSQDPTFAQALELGPLEPPPSSTEAINNPRVPSKNKPASPKDKRKKSPPPTSKETNWSPLVWHDSEITGHLMDDAEDDGIGINGIGFRPTPAIADARAQKRKQQIAEWRARETKEARKMRGERRMNGSREILQPISSLDDAADENKKVVRFA